VTSRGVLERFVRRLPKVELHVHIEGAIRPETLLTLARRRDVDLPAASEEGLRRFFRFRDFEHFVEVYLLCSSCLREPEDFQLVVEDFLAAQERQRVLYTEAHLTISTHVANGVNADEVADALRETIGIWQKERGVHLRLIADIVRNAPYRRADQTLEWALDHREDLVVALGLGGIERYPCDPFREHFEEAERLGLNRVAHAGEQTTAADVSRVIGICKPQRVGHGIRAVDDAGVVATLVGLNLPLEICPTSNVQLGNCASLEDHPLVELHRSGVPLSINSDDPALFETSLEDEYLIAAELLDLDPAGLADLSLATLEQAFIPREEKPVWRERFVADVEGALAELAE
jgi:adenosine deaminase